MVAGTGEPGNFDVCELFRLRRLVPEIRPEIALTEGERYARGLLLSIVAAKSVAIVR